MPHILSLPDQPGGFFIALCTFYQKPIKKYHFKVLVLIIFSYLCLPKKRGNKVLPLFFENQFFKFYAEVAQLVEQLICNQQVAGSTPVFGSGNC